MNKAVLDTDVQEYIRRNMHSDIIRISLAKSPFPGVSSRELARQIDGRRRCRVKLPLWYDTPGIYYPEKLALEQCSSEATAKYKSGLVLGNKVIDLTGGFGVDAVFLSGKAVNVTHCELNSELSDISNHNSKILGFAVNHIKGDGIEFLKGSDDLYDTIYIDPSRRISSRKVFMLKDCEPDVAGNQALLRRRAERVIIKTAPLLDLQSTLRELGAVTEVHIVSVRNECREVLYILDKLPGETDPLITCAILHPDKVLTFAFRASEEKAYSLEGYSQPLKYLYEPDVSLLKAGCFKLITRKFEVGKLHQHTHLYTSEVLRESFIGRKFRVRSTWDYGDFIKTHNFNKANVICRNFPHDPEKIRKKLRINDGGDDYLLFCTGSGNELLVIHCDRIL